MSSSPPPGSSAETAARPQGAGRRLPPAGPASPAATAAREELPSTQEQRRAAVRQPLSRWRWAACLLPVAAIPVLVGLGVPPGAARGLGVLGFTLLGWVSGWLHPSLVALGIVVLVPLLGLAPFERALVGYGQPFVWLFVSTFVIAAAMEHTGLGRRIALALLRRAGGRSSAMLLALFATAALLGFVVPTTAGRSAILLPLCSSLVGAAAGEQGNGGTADPGVANLARAIFLGVSFVSINTAWAVMTASTSAVYAVGAVAHLTGFRWDYLTWLLTTLPILTLFVLGLWWWLQRAYPTGFDRVPGGAGYLRAELARLGPVKGSEWRTILLLSAMVGLWLTEPYHHLEVPYVGLATAIALCLPGLGVVGWQQAAARISWDVIIQFGAAYALTQVLASSGTGYWLAGAVVGRLPSVPPALAGALVIGVVTLLRLGLANMVAMVSMFLPVAVELARAWGLNPAWLAHLVLIASGFAFFLPAQTPTTAMAYGYGYFSLRDMRRAGWRAFCLAGSLTMLFALLGWPRVGIAATAR